MKIPDDRTFAIAAIGLAISLTMVPAPTLAEGFVDIYGGAALTQNANVRFDGSSTRRGTRRLDFDTGFTAGIRGGNWFENVPWLGIAGDLSFFQQRAEAARISVVPATFLLMLRYPKGSLRPYVGVGPSFVSSDANIDFGPALGRVNDFASFDFGFAANTGLDWRLSDNISVFLEYRYSYVDLDWLDISFNASLIPDLNDEAETNLNTHHILVGIRF